MRLGRWREKTGARNHECAGVGIWNGAITVSVLVSKGLDLGSRRSMPRFIGIALR